MKRFLSIGACLLCAVAAQEGSAQQSAVRSVTGSGGGSGGAGVMRLTGTFGQTVAGVARADGHRMSHGFWTARHAASAIAGETAVTGRETASGLVLLATPNPLSTGTELTIQAPAGGPITATLTDMLGRTVRTLVSNERSDGSLRRIWIDAAGLPSGRYSATLISGAARRTISLVIVW